MCVVIQGLDASNWRLVGLEHVGMERQCFHVPPYKLQNLIRTWSHEWKRADKKRTLRRQSCRWKLHHIYDKKKSKCMDCQRQSILTWYPGVPTLQKEWGKGRMSYICSFNFEIYMVTVFKWYISASRSSAFPADQMRTWAHPWAYISLNAMNAIVIILV